jgi:hypothetical protein
VGLIGSSVTSEATMMIGLAVIGFIFCLFLDEKVESYFLFCLIEELFDFSCFFDVEI